MGTKMQIKRYGNLGKGGNFGILDAGGNKVEADVNHDQATFLSTDGGIKIIGDPTNKKVNFNLDIDHINGGEF